VCVCVCVCVCVVWFGLVWFGLVWFGWCGSVQAIDKDARRSRVEAILAVMHIGQKLHDSPVSPTSSRFSELRVMARAQAACAQKSAPGSADCAAAMSPLTELGVEAAELKPPFALPPSLVQVSRPSTVIALGRSVSRFAACSLAHGTSLICLLVACIGVCCVCVCSVPEFEPLPTGVSDRMRQSKCGVRRCRCDRQTSGRAQGMRRGNDCVGGM
jgi:hypothetical protein